MKRLFFIGLIFFPIYLGAQYFGQNKVTYGHFPFKVLESPHFEIHHYLDEDHTAKKWAQYAEAWYQVYESLLRDTLERKNPILFYNNQAHFQQTKAISSRIGVGTGGVTESLKNRVIMPFSATTQQSHHVLGHELVHAFQYHMILSGDSTNFSNLRNLPLWMVEGMAEYLSIGRIDPHTAMWMRDAYLHDRIPPLRKLSQSNEYFPYRYGQAFWAYLTGTYGDTIIRPFFMATAKSGIQVAADSILGTKERALSQDWQNSLKKYYTQQLAGRKEQPLGKKLISAENAGHMNISPALSPNGKYLIFFSEKDLFTVDLFLADAHTGKVLRKLASTQKDQQLDDFQYLESFGSWSPDSRQFAFVAYQKGRNTLVIKEALSGKTTSFLTIDGVPALTNPSWSPDGNHIAFTGSVEGQTDLYLLDVNSEAISQLTDDEYAELHPSWSPDGTQLVFSTDRLSRQQGMINGKWSFNLATLNIASKEQVQIELFLGANNLNPNFDAEQRIVFLSNRDGFRNIYRYTPSTAEVFQISDFITGVSGITSFAPAIHIGNERQDLVYVHYYDRKYTIYRAKMEQLLQQEVDPDAVDFSAAILPAKMDKAGDLLKEAHDTMGKMAPLSDSLLVNKVYRSKLKLDYIGGGGGIGIGTSSSYGNSSYLSGGVDLLFGDMLGHHQLYTGLFLNGEIYDFGAIASYVNQKGRMAWGVSISHLPYRSGISYLPVLDTIDEQYLAINYTYDIIRIFEEQAGIFAYWPFSQTLRAEFGAAAAHYHYRIDRYNNYYSPGGYLLDVDRKRLDAPDPFNLANIYTAIVGDNSHFGIASPMQGYRYRIGLDHYFGEWEYLNFTFDFRKYYWLKPVSLGFRFIHIARQGRDATQITPMYVGNPLLVRGYGYQLDRILRYGLDYDQLMGSKLAVANAELRLPLSGPGKLAVIPNQVLFSELAWFVDGGGAWDRWKDFQTPTVDEGHQLHKLIFSTGISSRLNIYGALVVEIYYAVPLQRAWKGVWGVNFLTSGW